jgi:hypothetical protein
MKGHMILTEPASALFPINPDSQSASISLKVSIEPFVGISIQHDPSLHIAPKKMPARFLGILHDHCPFGAIARID